MQQKVPLQSVSKLVKESLKSSLFATFPPLAQAKFDIQLNSVNNSLEYEYQCPTMLKIFNQFKKQNYFEGCSTAKEAASKLCESFKGDNAVIKALSMTEQGFLNIQLSDQFIESQINIILKSGVVFPLEQRKKIAVDFSSPNIAKEMHVGHLRSTIIGESLCRILEYQGNEVIRVNHLGDWGTQFGMLIASMLDKYPDFEQHKPDLKELQQFYKEAKTRFDKDEEFKKVSQTYVVKLQSGDPLCIEVWKYFCQVSRQEFNKIYERLGVKVDEYGESFYNPMLPGIVKECEEKGIVKEDKGAKCIFLKGFSVPLMVQKSDGGYNYDTTDMAASKVRLAEWKCDRAIYLTDMGQSQHFKMIFEAAKLMGWHCPPKNSQEHMGFGLVLGPDGKRFKSRSGDTVKLQELLDEGHQRALDQIKTRVKEQSEGKEFSTGSNLDPQEYEEAAEKMGMASIKYFDLKQNRISDYNFNYEKMLDPKGNTAVYLLYSYVRIKSVLRKSELDMSEHVQKEEFRITHPNERLLASVLIKYPDVVQSVTDQLAINWLCDFIYDICVRVSESYQKYKILDEEHLKTRILLCEAVKRVLDQSFYLVGIEPIEKI